MRRLLTISPNLFLGFFQAGKHPEYTVRDDVVPDDARIVGVGMSLHGELLITIASESFNTDRPITPVCQLRETDPWPHA